MAPWRLWPAPSVFVAALLLGVLGGGCSSPQEPSLCQRTLAPEVDEEEEEGEEEEGRITIIRPIRPEEWLSLIVGSTDGQRTVQECTGDPIRLPQPSEACQEALEERREEDPDFEEEPPPVPVTLSADSVIERRASKSQRLIWIITHQFANGDGFGPIALVKREDTEDEGTILRVTAMGNLRARKLRVRLRIETIQVPEMAIVYGEHCPEEDEENGGGGGGGQQEGEDEEEPECEPTQFLLRTSGITCRDQNRPETCRFERRYLRRMRDYLRCVDTDRPQTCFTERQVLIAEGETCEDPEDIATCSRAASFMFRVGSQFRHVELHHMNGDCLGPAQMVFSDHTTRDISGDWVRDFTLTTSFDINDSGYLLLHEQVVAVDLDPSREEVPPRPFREAETNVRWYPFEGRFVTATPSLWVRMLEDTASLELPPPSTQSASR